ncbi:IS701 family transposase [Actinocrinis sp.]|uniref:IS701 family transposase n=1 Tax=Actinocrinis sp. TaxID=1920516 RepID=UPI0032C227EF
MARLFLLGLLSGVERKNCWNLAEHAGLRDPQPLQRLLREAVWDADVVRDDVRDLVVEHLGTSGVVLVVDETGFLKKGERSIAVQCQYTGTAGRIENAQVAVFLAYASAKGRALVNRRVYLPASWCRDRERCPAAGVPEQTGFATKPRLALEMIEQAHAAGAPAMFVAADEVYGNDPAFRTGITALGLSYVLAVACDHRITVHGGIRRRVDQIATALPPRAWQRYSAGAGSKSPRYYDWAWIDAETDAGPGHNVLIRRNSATSELAFYRCHSPHPTTLPALVKVAGTRLMVEERFQTAKGQVRLDHYQVRGWTPWHRHITPAMLALAFLAITAAHHAPPRTATAHEIAHHKGPLRPTVPEIRRLFTTPADAPDQLRDHIIRWSAWRTRHQACAKAAHYRHHLGITPKPQITS